MGGDLQGASPTEVKPRERALRRARPLRAGAPMEEGRVSLKSFGCQTSINEVGDFIY